MGWTEVPCKSGCTAAGTKRKTKKLNSPTEGAKSVGVSAPLLPPGVHSVHFPRSHHPEARGHLSEALTEDTGVGNSVAGSPLPLTTGNENLDVAIVIHLQYCNHVIQVAPPALSRCIPHAVSFQLLILSVFFFPP